MTRSLAFNPRETDSISTIAAWRLLSFDEEIVPPHRLNEKEIPLFGAPQEVLKHLRSSRSYRLWEVLGTANDLVEPSQVVFTDHRDYVWLYPEDDSGRILRTSFWPGKRPDPGDGYLTGWNKPFGSEVVSMRKHPDFEKYVVMAGNHRTMKTKLFDGPPIHASVGHSVWEPLPKCILDSLTHFEVEHPSVTIEHVAPYPSNLEPALIALRLRPKTQNSRGFWIRVNAGSYDRKQLQSKLRIASADAFHPDVILDFLGTLIA